MRGVAWSNRANGLALQVCSTAVSQRSSPFRHKMNRTGIVKDFNMPEEDPRAMPKLQAILEERQNDSEKVDSKCHYISTLLFANLLRLAIPARLAAARLGSSGLPPGSDIL
jgi:hypothetical protein